MGRSLANLWRRMMGRRPLGNPVYEQGLAQHDAACEAARKAFEAAKAGGKDEAREDAMLAWQRVSQARKQFVERHKLY